MEQEKRNGTRNEKEREREREKDIFFFFLFIYLFFSFAPPLRRTWLEDALQNDDVSWISFGKPSSAE